MFAVTRKTKLFFCCNEVLRLEVLRGVDLGGNVGREG